MSPSLGKITVEHFQARLRAVDDLEPEYIAFYAKQLNDVDNQVRPLIAFILTMVSFIVMH